MLPIKRMLALWGPLLFWQQKRRRISAALKGLLFHGYFFICLCTEIKHDTNYHAHD